MQDQVVEEFTPFGIGLVLFFFITGLLSLVGYGILHVNCCQVNL